MANIRPVSGPIDGRSAVPAPVGHPHESDAAYVDESAFSFDFAAIWAAVYRSRYWIIGIFFACLLAGIVITILSTPVG